MAGTAGSRRRSRQNSGGRGGVAVEGGTCWLGQTDRDISRVVRKDRELVEIVGVGARTTGEHVHAEGGFPDSPEPVTFGEASFGEETTGHNNGRTPVPFHGAVLGLTVGGRHQCGSHDSGGGN
jgi:hypothetical protein